MDSLRRKRALWDLFTRKEEYDSPVRDHYDRFPSSASSNPDIFSPQVSSFLHQSGYRPEYPGKKTFAVCLTHDIDVVYKSAFAKGRSVLSDIARKKSPPASRPARWWSSKKVPFCNFPAIMDLEERFGARSTFFFMAENPGEMSYAYTPEDLEQEIRDITTRGWEVGLHGGYTAALNPRGMQEKKDRLEKIIRKPVTGYRNHVLRFRVPDTWEYLAQAGFAYDTTLGYADCAGFRNGMCHPFRPFNLNSDREIGILEIPLVVMDDTLGGKYMQLDNREKWEVIRLLIDRTASCNGVFTLLWHNTFFQGEEGALYEKILQYCSDKGAWMTSAEEIARHFSGEQH